MTRQGKKIVENGSTADFFRGGINFLKMIEGSLRHRLDNQVVGHFYADIFAFFYKEGV